jgi:hypothetical protein
MRGRAPVKYYRDACMTLPDTVHETLGDYLANGTGVLLGSRCDGEWCVNMCAEMHVCNASCNLQVHFLTYGI